MAVSILHRATGVALSFAGLGILAWWLYALSSGPEAYATGSDTGITWLPGG